MVKHFTYNKSDTEKMRKSDKIIIFVQYFFHNTHRNTIKLESNVDI